MLLKENHFDILKKVKLPQSDSQKQVQVAQTDWFEITTREEFTQNSTTQADAGHGNLEGLGEKGVSRPINNLVLTDVTSADRQPKREKRSFKHRRRKRCVHRESQCNGPKVDTMLQAETVTNLSDHTLTEDQSRLLSKGLTFVPDRKSTDVSRVLADLLMALFFKVSGYSLYNHLAYFLLIGCLGWATLFYCGTP